jgi:hypothetical protein
MLKTQRRMVMQMVDAVLGPGRPSSTSLMELAWRFAQLETRLDKKL